MPAQSNDLFRQLPLPISGGYRGRTGANDARPESRMTTAQAKHLAAFVNKHSSGLVTAQSVILGQGVAIVECRSTVRPFPLVATLRSEADLHTLTPLLVQLGGD